MSNIENLSRRQFLKMTGMASGSLVLGASVDLKRSLHAETLTERPELNLFVGISPNNRVSIVCHRSEMGQGIRTSVAQIIADELEADWTLVDVVQADADEAYGDQNTDGSTSIRMGYTKLRRMGAAARLMLRQAAAKEWQVDASECHAENHRVTHLSGKSLSYGELAHKASLLPAPGDAEFELKRTNEFKYIGRGLGIVDGEDIVNGAALFGQDVRLPNMLFASIERCPVIGQKVLSYDDTDTVEVSGVLKTIKIDGVDGPPLFNALAGVAVIARNSFAAMQGRKKLDIQWSESPHSVHNSSTFMDQLTTATLSPGKVRRKSGDINAGFTNASMVIDAQYTVPYLAHAPMEPPAATAVVHSDGSCEVWACVQDPQTTQKTVAGALGIDPSQVDIHVTLLGGAFGRKSKPDFVTEAAILAKALGQPIKVVWNREDDIQHGYYHAISAQYLKAAIDENNQVTSWLGRAAYPTIMSTFAPAETPQDWELGMAFADIPFAIENIQIEAIPAPSHVRIGWMRSVANIHQSFAVNSFVDELAAATETDARDFFLQLIGPDRHVNVNQGGYQYANYNSSLEDHPIDAGRYKRVLEVVCERAGWGKSMPDNEGMGIAVQRSFSSYVAVATHVKVENGQLDIKRIHCVADCGTIANIDRVHAQMEGAMIFGLSISLMGEITVKDGVVEQSNYDSYPVTRLNQTPDIDVYIIPNDGSPGGVGEPGVPPVMASITNAIYAASGLRIRDLPIKGKLDFI